MLPSSSSFEDDDDGDDDREEEESVWSVGIAKNVLIVRWEGPRVFIDLERFERVFIIYP